MGARWSAATTDGDRSRWRCVVGLACLLLLTSCGLSPAAGRSADRSVASATPATLPTMPPSPAPTLPAPPTPTVAPTATPSAAAARAAARTQVAEAAALLGDHYFQNLGRIAAALQAATRSYLEGVAGIATLQTDAAARDGLAKLLTLPGRWGPGPTIDVPSINGTVAVLLVSYPQTGLPMQAFYQQDGRLQALTLAPGLSSDRALGNFHMRFDRAVDVTGDGRKELIVRTDWLSGDSSPYTIGILGWDGRRLAPLFIGDVSNWSVGQADWQLVPHGGGQDVVLRCPAWGPFDHHLLQHPTLTRTYRWNGGAIALASVTLAPAIDQRDAFNRAEVAFRQGDFATAISRYHVVTSDHRLLPPEHDVKTNWPALAWLRIGQSQALLGDTGLARTSLARAVAAGGTIGSLARAFGAALGPKDSVAQALAAMQATAGAQQVQDGTASNLGVEIDAPGLLYAGNVRGSAPGKRQGNDSPGSTPTPSATTDGLHPDRTCTIAEGLNSGAQVATR